jgi:hypothetical protein
MLFYYTISVAVNLGGFQILVQSEFDSGKPPVEHPATSVVHVIISFLQKKVVNICYITGGTVM